MIIGGWGVFVRLGIIVRHWASCWEARNFGGVQLDLGWGGGSHWQQWD